MDSDKLRTEYEKRRPLYCELVREVKFALEEQIRAQGVKVAGVVGRAKTVDSLIQKAKRKHYGDPLREIDDLAGVRVICLFEPDLDKMQGLIQDSFTVVDSDDKTGDLGLDRMGYQGASLRSPPLA